MTTTKENAGSDHHDEANPGSYGAAAATPAGGGDAPSSGAELCTTDAPAVLASLQGRQPDRPAWFEWAISQEPEVVAVSSAGGHLDARVWGEPGKPGLLFLHGFIAHADWWSFIAPFFAQDY